MVQREAGTNAPETLGYEPNKIDIRFAISLIVGIVLVVVLGLWLMSVYFQLLASDGPAVPANPVADSLRRIGQQNVEPILDPGKRQQLEELRAGEKTLMQKYEWIDESAGIARIPIDRAMEILAKKRLPVRDLSGGGAGRDQRSEKTHVTESN